MFKKKNLIENQGEILSITLRVGQQYVQFVYSLQTLMGMNINFLC